MGERIKELLQQIIVEAYEVNKKIEYDINIDFAGSVNSIHAYYFKNRDTREKEIVYLNDYIRLNEKRAVKELERLLEDIKKMGGK